MKKTIKLLLTFTLVISTMWFAPFGQPEDVSAYFGWVGADDSPYYGGVLPQPFDINVSNDNGISVSGFDRDLVLDQFDNPHIAWFSNNSSGDEDLWVYYVHWDDTLQTWLCANGADYTTSPASARVGNQTADVDDDYASLSLAIDSNRRPHLAISGVDDDDGDIVYVRWNGTAWVSLDGTDYITDPDAANITHPDNFSGGRVVFQGLDCFPSLALDSENNPNIAWQHQSDQVDVGRSWEVYFVHTVQNQSIWRSSGSNGFMFHNQSQYDNCRVSNNDGDSQYPSLIVSFLDPLDSAGIGMPHIAWQDDTWNGNEEIAYVKWHGDENGGNASPWYCADESAYDPSIINNPANVSRNPNPSNSPSLIVNSSNDPVIAWEDSTNTVGGNIDIFLARWSDIVSDWVCADGSTYNPVLNPNPVNVTRNTGDSVEVSLAIDSTNAPHIAWCDDSYTNTYSNFNLFYIGWNGTDWAYADTTLYDPTEDPNNCNVSENDWFSWAPTLALDTDDVPHIAWTDETGSPGGPMPNGLPTDSEFTTQNWNDDFGGWNASEVYYVTWDNSFDGELSLQKSVDSDQDGLFDDDGELVVSSGILTYQVDYDYLSGNDPVLEGYIYDSIPDGTYYIGGSMSPIFEYSTDNGTTWIPGEAPHGSPGGTMFRWALDTNNGWNSLTILFSVQIINPPLAWVFCNTATLNHLQIDDPMESNTVCNTLDYRFTGSFEVSKDIDVDDDGFYEDNGWPVERGATACYEIQWSFDNPNNDPLAAAYLYDTIPEGTTYLTGAIPNDNISYSEDGGMTWLSGEPPTGSVGGTILRWGPLPYGWVGADDSSYVGLVASQPADINVSRNLSDSNTHLSYSVAIDSMGNPHIVWYDLFFGNYEVFYVYWGGNDWLCFDGSVYDPSLGNANISQNLGTSIHPSIQIDSTGVVHIMWDDLTSGIDQIYYLRLVNGNRICSNGSLYVPGVVPNDANISMQIAGAGGGNYCNPHFVLDQNNYACVTWYSISSGNDEIYFIRWNGTAWVTANSTSYDPITGNANISNDPIFSRHASIDLDDSGNPFIAWMTETAEIALIRWDGTNWVTANGTIYDPVTMNANISNNLTYSARPELVVDSNNYAHVTWRDGLGPAADIFYMRWNGANWNTANGTLYDGVNANVSNDIYYTDTQHIALDSDDNPHLTWSANFEIFYIFWDGSNWVSADGSTYNPVITPNPANISNNIGFSSSSFLTLDDSDDPHIVWTDSTFRNNEIFYIHWAPTERTFNFCVEIEDVDCWDKDGDPIIRSITNRAYFTHAFGPTPQYTNYVISPLKFCPIPEEEKVVLTIDKTAQRLQYKLGEIAVFSVRVANEGNIDATDVELTDIFPRELKYISSRPEGASGINGWKYNIGTLRAGDSRYFVFKFRIDASIKLGERPLTLENIATVTCNELDALTDSAVITVFKKIVTEKINLVVVWTGIDTKTSKGEAGTEITLDMVASGGSSPYEIYIDWGDDEKTVVSEVEREATASHTFGSSGEYKVVIKLVDRFGKTTYVERVVFIN